MKLNGPHLLLFVVVLTTAACSAEIGSEAWCKEMQEKPKEEWLAEEISPFFSSCIAGQPIEKDDRQ
jgi:hypothetical protein